MHNSVSDHDLVYLTLRLKKPCTKPVYINIRSFKHYNREAFYNDISQALWPVIDVFTDIDDKVNPFNTMFNDILNQHAPIKSIKVKGKPNPCVNENIHALMNTRDHWRKPQACPMVK
jgi:hypothetical protein